MRWARSKSDESVRVVVFGQGGSAFSAGVEPEALFLAGHHGRRPEGQSRVAANIRDVLRKVRLFVIRTVREYALAGGLELGMTCGFVSAPECQVGDKHDNFRLVPVGWALRDCRGRSGINHPRPLLTDRRIDGMETLLLEQARPSWLS